MKCLRPRYLFLLILLCVGVLSFVFLSEENSAYACEPSSPDAIIVKSVTTYLESGPSPTLTAHVLNSEAVCWTISNAYPGETAYLRVTYKNISKKSVSTDSFTFLKPNGLNSQLTITHSKKVIKPGELGDCIVKMKIIDCMRTRTYPFVAKLWFYG